MGYHTFSRLLLSYLKDKNFYIVLLTLTFYWLLVTYENYKKENKTVSINLITSNPKMNERIPPKIMIPKSFNMFMYLSHPFYCKSPLRP